MLIDHTVIAFVFRILNFAIVIGVCAYIFKKYIYVSVLEQMNEHTMMFKRLRTHKDDLGKQNEALNEQLEQQQELCVHLKKQLGQWREDVQTQRQRSKQRQAELHEYLHTLRVKQEDALRLYIVEKEVMPRVVEQATHEVQRTFTSEPKGQQFLAAILEQLRKETV